MCIFVCKQRVTGERDRALEGLQRLSATSVRQAASNDQLERMTVQHQQEITKLQEKKVERDGWMDGW